MITPLTVDSARDILFYTVFSGLIVFSKINMLYKMLYKRKFKKKLQLEIVLNKKRAAEATQFSCCFSRIHSNNFVI